MAVEIGVEEAMTYVLDNISSAAKYACNIVADDFIEYTVPYVPYKTGNTTDSARIEGEAPNLTVVYEAVNKRGEEYTPYIYEYDYNFNRTVHAFAGNYWVERSLAANLDAIIADAQRKIELQQFEWRIRKRLSK